MNLYLIERPAADLEVGDYVGMVIAAPDEARVIDEACDHVQDDDDAVADFSRIDPTTIARLGTGPGPVRVILDSRLT